MTKKVTPPEAEPVVPPVVPAEPVAPVEPAAPVVPVEPTEPVIPTEPEDVPPVVPEKRPVAYIPLPKYHAEIKAKDDKIKELEALVAKPAPITPATAKVDAAAIQAYADKHGMEPDAVQDLIALLPKPESGAAMAPEALEEFNRIVKEDRDRKAAAFEEKDWTENALPTLKELFPSITDEQVKKAQALLDPIAHTEDGVNLGYDFLVFKNKGEIAKLLEDPAAPAAPQNKVTLERGKLGAGSPTRLTAKDFSDDKPDFSMLDSLSPEDQSALVNSFDSKAYKSFLVYKSTTAPLEVMRGGAKIKLK